MRLFHNNISDVSLCIIFCGLIAIPTLGTIFGWDFYPYNGENRVLASFPDRTTKLAELPASFEAYYADHFGFRNTLIRRYQKLYGKTSSKVLFGEDGWLFLESSVKDYLGLRPHASKAVEEIGQQYENRRAWLAERNIHYLLVVPPDKAEIYPDQLSIDIPEEAVRITRYDQLSSYIRTNTDVDLLYLREPLQAARSEQVVYLSNDTHWNPYGGHVGYTAIVKKLQTWKPDIKPLTLKDYISAPSSNSGDLTILAGLPDAKPIPIETLTPKDLQQRSITDYPVGSALPWHQWPKNVNPPQKIHNPEGQGRLLVFHDSFGLTFMNLLPTHFEDSAFFWIYPSPEALENMVREFQPDIVMEIHLQRRLHLTEGSPLRE